MIQIDHVGIPAHDVDASAHFLCEILGLPRAEAEASDLEMFCVTISPNSSLLYYPSQSPAKHHIAFRVDTGSFAKVIDRMRQRNILFGSDPENFTTDTAGIGGQERIFFRDPNGHIFEILT